MKTDQYFRAYQVENHPKDELKLRSEENFAIVVPFVSRKKRGDSKICRFMIGYVNPWYVASMFGIIYSGGV